MRTSFKGILLILVIAFSTGLAFYLRYQKDSPSLNHPSAFPDLGKKEIARRESHPPLTAGSSPATHLRNPAIVHTSESVSGLKNNVIEFKVIDGLAVAYGDVILGRPEDAAIEHGFTEVEAPRLWDRPDIPYLVSPELHHPERVEKSLEYFRLHTVVNFFPYQNQKDAILFEPGTEHCLSVLGKVGGIQPIKLSDECQVPEVLHEIMHSLGFIHEQSRPDRDQYVEVIWPNIDEKFRSQFIIAPDSFFISALKDSAFDYQSVMLYTPDSFAIKPGLFTLKSLGKEQINPSKELSESDIKRVNRLYQQ